ncbi:MAG TPA: penicillin-binding transpeptidase domain-containing protein [Ktedonobacterales bacterium]|nr:penicillin-binding transpeptidase domain-containing protein [Ktedonobacterales bacterium]
MNSEMVPTIRRLVTTFLILFLVLSGVAAYVQITNQVFLNGPALAQGQYDPRKCPPYDAPVRGAIYDRNGVRLAWTEQDPKAQCGYKRVYDPRVATSGLAPLMGYYSSRFGTAGVEASFNDQLAGTIHGQTVQDVTDKLLHRPRHGQDVYLTIDINLQVAASKYYDDQNSYLSSSDGSPCQLPGTHPPGAMVVEDPNTGEIMAMVSKPSFDPNKIDDETYFKRLQADPLHPLLDRPAQGLYVPGSSFKTLTLISALDSGKANLADQFTKDEAVNYVANGRPITWDDYVKGEWPQLNFPITLDQGFAYSDNVIFAREATTVGADTWLDYVSRFGILVPGKDVKPIPFDAPFSQSQAFSRKPSDFDGALLAESGFGQGELQISPLTNAVMTSAVAANGVIHSPHVLLTAAVSGTRPQDAIASASPTTDGTQVFSADTAAKVRQSMWSVTDFGTAAFSPNPVSGAHLDQSPVEEGGKTGTAQLDSGFPHTWWISLAPDDQAPGGGPAKMVVVVMKEHSGEGACQVWVGDNTYRYAIDHHIGPYK